MRIKSNSKSSNILSSPESTILNVTNERKAYAESEAYDSASVASVASVNQPLETIVSHLLQPWTEILKFF